MSDQTPLKCSRVKEILEGNLRDQKEDEDEEHSPIDESLLTNNFEEQLEIIKQSNIRKTKDEGPSNVGRETNQNQTPVSKTKVKKNPKVNPNSNYNQKPKAEIRHHSTIYKLHEDSPDDPSLEIFATEGTTKNRPVRQYNANNSPNLLMPPPFAGVNFPNIDSEDEAQASMLMSWYMAGYHTGYFAAIKKLSKSG